MDLSVTEHAAVTTVMGKLSRESGVAYRATSKTHGRLIVARLRDGVTEPELRAVIAYCASPKTEGGKGWRGDPKMHEFLRPETLFGPEAIERYLAPARTWAAELLARGPT